VDVDPGTRLIQINDFMPLSTNL